MPRTRVFGRFGGGGYHMGWARFGASGFLLLGFAGVALVAVTTNAAERQHHRDIAAQELHHSRLVHHRVQATHLQPVATSAAVRKAAQLPDEQSTGTKDLQQSRDRSGCTSSRITHHNVTLSPVPQD
jgi:hypothetical protein